MNDNQSPEINDGGPVYPTIEDVIVRRSRGTGRTSISFDNNPGMSLRDYFAAKAMQRYIVAGGGALGNSDIADMAYNMADAMIARRTY